MKTVLRRMILTIVFLSVFVGCRSENMPIATPAAPANGLITQGIPQSIKTFERRALEAAQRWRSDVYLISAAAIVPASRPDGTFTIRSKVTFSFRSKADVQRSYLVSFNSEGVLDVFEFSDAVPQSDDLPIESNDWLLDSLDAWQIVLTNGGSTLLEEYQQQTIDMRCSTTLQRWSPQLKPSGAGRVLWDVLCLDAVTLKSFHFWIDAQTGEAVEKGTD